MYPNGALGPYSTNVKTPNATNTTQPAIDRKTLRIPDFSLVSIVSVSRLTINGADRRYRLQSCSTKVKRSNQGYQFEPLVPNTASRVREPPALTASARNDCEALTAIPAGI